MALAVRSIVLVFAGCWLVEMQRMEQLGRVLRTLGAGLGVRRVPRGACGVKGGGGGGMQRRRRRRRRRSTHIVQVL